MTSDPITTEEYFRGTLKVIAHWSEVDLSGEWETGLRGVIRSITDMARETLSAHPEKPATTEDDTLVRQLREMATDFAIDNKTDCKQHVCWIAADRLSRVLAQSAQVSTLAKLADKWRVQAKQYDEAAKECYDRGDDDEGDMNDIEGSALFRCATELDTALKSLAAQPPAAPVETRPSVREYIANYRFEMDGGGSYCPTEREEVMLEDAIEGYLACCGEIARPTVELAAGLRTERPAPHSSAGNADTVKELAVWLTAVGDANMYEPVPESLVTWARVFVNAGLTEKHSGDCTNESHSCVVCSTSDAMDKAKQILTALNLLRVAPQATREWVSPIKTVADLVNNLLTIDQSMEVFGAYFLPDGVKDRCRARGLSLSRERVANNRIKQGADIPYSLVIWSAQDERNASNSGDGA